MDTDPKVALNYRYTATYNELCTRIAQRQQAMQIYVMVLAFIVAALVNLSTQTLAQGQTAPVGPLFLGIPIISLYYACLTLKHEMMISNLRAYLKRLERINTTPAEEISFNSDERWRRPTLRWRRFHDIAAAILVAAGNAFAFYVASEAYPDLVRLRDSIFLISVVIACACFVMVLYPAVGKRWNPSD